MDVAATLGRIEEQFEGGDPHGALGELGELVAEVAGRSEADRARLLAELTARIDHDQPALGAHFALAAGALVEGGLDPRELAEALLAPVARAVASAGRFVALAETYPDEPDAMKDDDDAVEVGQRTLSGASLAAIADEDDDAVASFFALDTWHHPVLSAWTRHTRSLAAAQSDPAIAASVAELEGRSEGAEWLARLLRVPVDAPFVILVPELDEAYALTVTGVAELGQLLVLFGGAVPSVFERLGAEAPARDVLDVLAGAGPQQLEASYTANLRFYPWQSLDPATGLPARSSARWAVAGRDTPESDASLADGTAPRDVAPLGDGTRVLVLVGPRASSASARPIAAARMFPALVAKLGSTDPLARDAVAALKRKLFAAKAS